MSTLEEYVAADDRLLDCIQAITPHLDALAVAAANGLVLQKWGDGLARAVFDARKEMTILRALMSGGA